MVAVFQLLYMYIFIWFTFGILDTNYINSIQFERIFDNSFSNYIFGHKNCYYYEISQDIINNECHQSTIVANTQNTNTNENNQPASTEANWFNAAKIFQSNTFKRRILDTNSDCFIGTLHLCPYTLSYEAKAYALKKLKSPSQACFAINIVDSKFDMNNGVGVEIFQIKDCNTNLYRKTEESEPFILCADDTIKTRNNIYFCDKNEQCLTNFETPNICNEPELPYIMPSSTTNNPTYKPTLFPISMPTMTSEPTNKPTKSPTPKPIPLYPTAYTPSFEATTPPTLKPTVDINNIKNEPKNPLTLDHNNIFNKIITMTPTVESTLETLNGQDRNIENELNEIEKDSGLNSEMNRIIKIPNKIKWMIGVVILIGICIMLNIGLIWGWKNYTVCDYYANNQDINYGNGKGKRELFWFQKNDKEIDVDCCNNDSVNDKEINGLKNNDHENEYKQEEEFEEQKVSESVFNQVYANMLNNEFYTDAENSDAEIHNHVLDLD